MNGINLMVMMAMMLSEEELIDKAVEGLQEYKEELEIWKAAGSNPDTAPTKPMAQLGLILTKFEYGDQDMASVMSDVQEKQDTFKAVKEFDDLKKDMNISSETDSDE